ncbi:hypothetical protein [Methanobacterium bryantii]|uniref:Uncharacterized protein n=1 Tax=Methanobacterium bryantii TaxID=2161 RepID=A0A2A2H7T2_METBR|nr:hypothetical protein [Methanobacterium bryantii]PAV05462.1 hypothetical protein ASJ80_09445 [Methanobacterium bryantii]
MGYVITNIKDPKNLERIAWKFNTRDILIVTNKPVGDLGILPDITDIQLKGNYLDSIKILNGIFEKKDIVAAVIFPDLFGMYLYSYISGFKTLPIIHICNNQELEPTLVNPGVLGRTKVKLLNYIKENSGSKTSDIFSGVGFKPGTSSAYVHMNDLKEMELVKEEDKRYYITDLGLTFLELT